MQCPQCLAENDSESRFRESCGTALARSCPSCGHELKPEARFCGKCGAELQGSGFRVQGSGIAEPRTPNPEPRPDGERRQVTALFCDLVGSTEIASRLDPEEWHRISKEYQEAAAAAAPTRRARRSSR